eukprot:g16060.t1
MAHINSSLPTCLNHLQFTYRHNRSTEDAISLEHLDNSNTYVRVLLVDYSSTFHTIIPFRLISKLCELVVHSAPCNWILSFLTHRLQSVRIDAMYNFTDNTTIVGRISNNDESKCRREKGGLVTWCNENNLSLNVSKTE